MTADDKKGISANVVVVMLGGRKMIGLAICLVALCYGPTEAHATIAMIFGIFVGGNGWEHHSKARQGPVDEVQ